MKKFPALLLALLMLTALASCGSKPPAEESHPPQLEASQSPEADPESVELIVFAAASMKETLTELEASYKAVAPHVTLVFNFESSGTLKTQIEEGAACDLFISAGQKQMNELDATAGAEANTAGLDYVLQGTRINLLENKVTLCVPEGNPAGIKDFDDLAAKLETADFLLAMGNSDVPVGQYTQKILAYYELDEKALASAGRITYCSNVKEVTTQITEASVAAGVVYCTDAFSAGLEILDYATAEMCGQIIYPAALIKTTKNADEAQAFLDYLLTPEAMSVFEAVGFAAA